MAKKTARKTKKRSAKRELIDTAADKQYMRRGKKGRFKESDDVGVRWPPIAARRQKPRSSRATATKATSKRKSSPSAIATWKMQGEDARIARYAMA
jgi:hypothetical protein